MSELRKRNVPSSEETVQRDDSSERKGSVKHAVSDNALRAVNGVAFVLFAFCSGIFYLFSDERKVQLYYDHSYLSGEGVLEWTTTAAIQVSATQLAYLYFFIASTHHLIIILPGVFPVYLKKLSAGQNPFRWFEYSFSSSTMIIILALAAGIRSLHLLISLFALFAVMIGSGWNSEAANHHNKTADAVRAHLYGWLAFAVVWGVLLHSVQLSQLDDVEAQIFIIFLLMCSFGAIQLLQLGTSINYRYIEVTYVGSSLLTKIILGGMVYVASRDAV